jgi:hypothetical protein
MMSRNHQQWEKNYSPAKERNSPEKPQARSVRSLHVGVDMPLAVVVVRLVVVVVVVAAAVLLHFHPPHLHLSDANPATKYSAPSTEAGTGCSGSTSSTSSSI